jgi:hypothetical protein
MARSRLDVIDHRSRRDPLEGPAHDRQHPKEAVVEAGKGLSERGVS